MRWYSLKGVPRASKKGWGASIKIRAGVVTLVGWDAAISLAVAVDCTEQDT
jgi:hypothetical protein